MTDVLLWRPIATAPRDGTLIVGALIADHRIWRVHEMAHNGLAFYTSAGAALPPMTHWLPMPLVGEAETEASIERIRAAAADALATARVVPAEFGPCAMAWRHGYDQGVLAFGSFITQTVDGPDDDDPPERT